MSRVKWNLCSNLGCSLDRSNKEMLVSCIMGSVGSSFRGFHLLITQFEAAAQFQDNVLTLWLSWLKHRSMFVMWLCCTSHALPSRSPIFCACILFIAARPSRNSSRAIFWHFGWLAALIVVISPAMCPSEKPRCCCCCDAQPEPDPAD